MHNKALQRTSRCNAALGSEEGLEKYLNDGMATAK
jgi:hypothetical protein